MIEGVNGVDASSGSALAWPALLLQNVFQFSHQLVTGITTYPVTYGLFAAMIILGLVLRTIPVLGRPLKWAETFYHELSHGIVCKLTGGRVAYITLAPGGGGMCTYGGGWRIPVAFAGYLGSAVWGGLLYLIGARLNAGLATYWLWFELAVIALTWLLWVRKYDLRTTFVLAVLASLYLLALLETATPTRVPLLPWLIQFAGLYVVLNAIEAPLVLLNYPGQNDATDLRKLTFIPATIWIAVWWLFALIVLGACAFATLPGLGTPITVTHL